MKVLCTINTQEPKRAKVSQWYVW